MPRIDARVVTGAGDGTKLPMIGETKAAQLEAAIRELTRPINGQYPRPWMTSSKDPASSKVFVVGMNQAKGFAVDDVGSHDRYLDALFNRGPQTCRQLYDRVTKGEASSTRINLDDLVRRLEDHGVTHVLETNVICYSTPMSNQLKGGSHKGGAARGREIFRALLDIVEPKILIAHGAGTAKELRKALRIDLAEPPKKRPSRPAEVKLGQMSVFLIPSLAPPEFNKWSSWRNEHLDQLCQIVAARLGYAHQVTL